ncbi:MAG: hypothetical protein PHD87_03600 [Candidatus Cloacimonetes bacterium]|nr:hypothetical protein [Candidatus Cloacimonadota bacterium]
MDEARTVPLKTAAQRHKSLHIWRVANWREQKQAQDYLKKSKNEWQESASKQKQARKLVDKNPQSLANGLIKAFKRKDGPPVQQGLP